MYEYSNAYDCNKVTDCIIFNEYFWKIDTSWYSVQMILHMHAVSWVPWYIMESYLALNENWKGIVNVWIETPNGPRVMNVALELSTSA
jgi:hypothetical protein